MSWAVTELSYTSEKRLVVVDASNWARSQSMPRTVEPGPPSSETVTIRNWPSPSSWPRMAGSATSSSRWAKNSSAPDCETSRTAVSPCVPKTSMVGPGLWITYGSGMRANAAPMTINTRKTAKPIHQRFARPRFCDPGVCVTSGVGSPPGMVRGTGAFCTPLLCTMDVYTQRAR